MKQQSLIFYIVLLVFSTLFSYSIIAHADADDSTNLEDGEYEIDFKLWTESEEEEAEIVLNEKGEATLYVEDSENKIHITLITNLDIKNIKIQETQPGTFEEDNFIPIDIIEKENTEDDEVIHKIVFQVEDLKEPLNAKILLEEKTVADGNEEPHNVRFIFGEPQKVEVEPNPEPEKPDPKPNPDPPKEPTKPDKPKPEKPVQETIEKGKYLDGKYELPFKILKDKSNQTSMANQFVETPAQLVVDGERYTVQMTLTNSSWWEYLKVQTVQPGTFKDENFNNVRVLKTNKKHDTQLVEFTVTDPNQILNAKVSLDVKEANYKAQHNIRFAFDTTKLPLNPDYQDRHSKPGPEPSKNPKKNNANKQKHPNQSDGPFAKHEKVSSSLKANAMTLLPSPSTSNTDSEMSRQSEESGVDESKSSNPQAALKKENDELSFDRDADEAMQEKEEVQEVEKKRKQPKPQVAGLNTNQIILFSSLLGLSIILLIIQLRKKRKAK